jgi:methionyl-tRNA formyltransferase
MKIVLFTSEKMGAVNELNINTLINNKNEYEYDFVIVKKNTKSKISNLKFKLKKLFLYPLTDWYKDQKKVSNLLKKEASKIPHKKKNIHYVKAVNSKSTEKKIKKLNPDLIIQCGAGIIKENIFSIPPKGTINIHHGIAPELRGIASSFWGMYYGLNEYIGTTVHFIDKTLDTGAVIVQKRTKVSVNSSFIETSFQTAIQGSKLLLDAVDIILGEYEIEEKEIDSFYFSRVHYSQYNELKKNGFQKVKNPDKTKTKKKIKSILIKKTVLK